LLIRSRSVNIPTGLPASSTTTHPILASLIVLTHWVIGSLASTVLTCLVMTLLTGVSMKDNERWSLSETLKASTRFSGLETAEDFEFLPVGNQRLYPIFLRNSLLSSLSASDSTPFAATPSTTPRIPLPSSISARTTVTGLAVAQ